MKLKTTICKIIPALLLAITCFGSTCSAAEIEPYGNRNFDILLTQDGIGEDPISPRETKDDDEQKFYVTITSSNSARGRLTAEIYQIDHHNFRSNKISMSSAAGTSATGTYKSSQPAYAGQQYFLYMDYTSNVNNADIHVKGRFCP